MQVPSWAGALLFGVVLLALWEDASAGRPLPHYRRAPRRSRELEYFPGVGLVEPLGLLVVASLPLFVVFSTMWLILPLWLKLSHVGLFSPGVIPGAVPGIVPGGVPAVGKRRRRDLYRVADLEETASTVLRAIREGLAKFS